MVLLLLIRCLLSLLKLWESVTVLCFVVRFWLLSFAYLPVSCDCCVALPRSAMGSLQFVNVAYPDHTHLLHMSDGNVMIYLCSTSFVEKLKMSQNFRQRNENLNSQFSKCGLIIHLLETHIHRRKCFQT